jgi:hypothetical protein
MIRAFYYLYIIVRFSDVQSSTFPTCFASTIDGYQEIVATAFYIQCDFPIIIDNDRADIEAVRSNRSNGIVVSIKIILFRPLPTSSCLSKCGRIHDSGVLLPLYYNQLFESSDEFLLGKFRFFRRWLSGNCGYGFLHQA